MFVNNGDELPVSTKQVIECLKAPQASLLLSSPFLLRVAHPLNLRSQMLLGTGTSNPNSALNQWGGDPRLGAASDKGNRETESGQDSELAPSLGKSQCWRAGKGSKWERGQGKAPVFMGGAGGESRGKGQDPEHPTWEALRPWGARGALPAPSRGTPPQWGQPASPLPFNPSELLPGWLSGVPILSTGCWAN